MSSAGRSAARLRDPARCSFLAVDSRPRARRAGDLRAESVRTAAINMDPEGAPPQTDPAVGGREGASVDLGIDLGTANTVISDYRHGILFDQPSVMVLRRSGSRRERVLAVGQDAAELLGRAPTSQFAAVRPLDDGVVTDLETTRLYLRSVLQ